MASDIDVLALQETWHTKQSLKLIQEHVAKKNVCHMFHSSPKEDEARGEGVITLVKPTIVNS